MDESVMPTAEVKFPGRLAVLQRVLAGYRRPFFEMLGEHCEGGVEVAAGVPASNEGIATAEALKGSASVVRLRQRRILGGRWHALWQCGITRWLDRWQPEALIAEANPRLLSTPKAARWMHRAGRPVLGWGLGTMAIHSRQTAVRGPARRFVFRHFDGIIAYGRRAAREYAAIGFPEERIYVAANAVAARPTKPPPERSEVPERLHLLFVGRLVDGKRLENLFEACGRLPESARPILTIVGDGPARSHYEAVARRHFQSARFVGAHHGDALVPFWAAADVFVLPGMGGLAVQEALGQGLPLIVARGDGTQEDLVGPENGWLVPPEDVVALERALIVAMDHRARLRMMGAESYRIASTVNLEAMCAAFVAALNNITELVSQGRRTDSASVRRG